jgi:hypothetical protein
MRKQLFLLTTILITLFSACSGTDKESTDKKDSSEEVNDSSETNEASVEQSEKQKMLTSMIGKHKLNSISGLVGMNSMFDFTVKDGIWKGEGSSNEGGEREGYDLEISDVELKKLNSMCIVVAEDLTVTLESNGKTYCKIPFDDNLKELKLDPASPHLEFDEILPKISAEKNVFNGWYYLLVRDDYSESTMEEIDIPKSFTPDFICIKVSQDLKEFQVEIKAEECCDSETYTFKK